MFVILFKLRKNIFLKIVGPGRRITPSATGLELMDQEYRKKMDQLGENVTQGLYYSKYFVDI